MQIWAAGKANIRPDDYISAALAPAALKLIDPRNLAQPALLTIVAAVAAYALLIASARALGVRRRHLLAVLVCITALAVVWLWFDRWVLSEARFDLRAVLLVGFPSLGVLAAL